MRSLSDLITNIKSEIKTTPAHNAAVLMMLGFAVTEKVKSMIGTKQIFWQDLKPSTIEQKARHGWGKDGDPSTPLFATGEYQKSVEYRLKNKSTVRIFSKLDYVQYLEYGTSKMPPRPVFKPATLLVLKELLGKNNLQKFYLTSLR